MTTEIKRITTIFFIVSILSHFLLQHHDDETMHAYSTSIPNQQLNLGRNVTQDCPSDQANVSKSLGNNIVGVTYSSDGEKLDLTVWFKDALLLRNDSSLHGKEVIAHIPPQNVPGDQKNQDLRNALKEIAALYNKTLPDDADHLDISKNGENASLIIQNDSQDSSQIYAKFELKNLSSSDLYTAVDILDELGVNFTYESLGNDIAKAFFQDYRMFIDVKSIYDLGWDYVTKFVWNDTIDKWNYTMGQYDPSAPQGDPGKDILDVPPPTIDRNYLEYDINLSALRYPKDLLVMFEMINTIATGFGRCEFYDRTDLIPIPPPQVHLTTDPDSLELLPGERARIQLILNSSTDIAANVNFAIDNMNLLEDSGIEIVRGPSPSHVPLPANSIATSELEVRPVSKNQSYTSVLRLLANVSFVTAVRLGQSDFETTSLLPLTIYTGIPISVKAPKGPVEQIVEGLDNAKVFAERVSGLLAAIAIIAGAGGIGGFVAFLKKMRSKSTKESAKHNQSNRE